jgi:L-lactate dehydrogenase complex protein LldG
MSLDDPEGRSQRARSSILARIRKAQGRGGRIDDPAALPASEREALTTYLRSHVRGPLPPVEGDLVGHFCGRASVMQSTTDRVADWNSVPAAVARYLAERNLPATGCVWPSIAGHDWASAGLAIEARAAVDADQVGITGAYAAIAETGTLMMLSGPETPGSVSLLPETHVAVVDAQRIVSHMEDAWELLRSERGRPPRAVSFISGPSRTGDIEQTIVIGAHGPYRVHILVVGR